MKSKKGDTARLKHILIAIDEIETYIAGVEFEEFQGNSMMKNAIIRQLEVIGEAVTRISDTTKKTYSGIDWKSISSMRNI